MKHYLFIALVFLVLGCSNSQPSQPETSVPTRDFQDILDEGKLTVLIENSSTSYFLYKGTPMGFEYDLLKSFCEAHELDLELKLVQNMDQIFGLLEHGKGDVAAANLTITSERLRKVNFTSPILFTKQVLVQRKLPRNQMVLDAMGLKDKEVHVRRRSSFYKRLKHLGDETGVDIAIRPVDGSNTVEELTRGVSSGDIDFTVADENVAKMLAAYHTNLDVSTELSTRQLIGWAVAKESEALTDTLTRWINTFKQTRKFKAVYARYFNSKGTFKKRMNHEYYTEVSGKISPFDEMLQRYAKTIDWDWKMLASLIYQESKFNPNARSIGGAFGVMQLMPATARQFGVDTVSGLEGQVNAGTKLIATLDKRWTQKIPNREERIKFVMGSYNAGLGHILDAYRLASKFDTVPSTWNQIVPYLDLKSKPKYYNDPVAKSGYCRCYITIKYVEEIMERYTHYSNLTEQPSLAAL